MDPYHYEPASGYTDHPNTDAGVLDLSRSRRSNESRHSDSALNLNRSARASPIGYEERRDPENSPLHRSPNYASCYPGPEQLNQYMLQAAAFQQQILMQQPEIKPFAEQDAISEAGSDRSHNNGVIPIYPLVSPGRDGKVTRPFKAYPKDPLSLTAGFDNLLDSHSSEKYAAFRKKMMDQICASNGGHATVSNPKMRRTVNTNNNNNNCYISDDGKEKSEHPAKDNSYTERRKKNNAAAKKSRDRRRIKEDEIAIRAAFLERENIELKFELAAARKQISAFNSLRSQIN